MDNYDHDIDILKRCLNFFLMLVSIGKAAQVLGVCIKTLRRWEAKNIIIPYRTSRNHRRYDLDALFSFLETLEYHPKPIHSTNTAAIYARVSSAKQKNDLATQAQYLMTYAKQFHQSVIPYIDIGSGLNDKRLNLLRLIKDALHRKFDSLYITYLDRLARFGTAPLLELFEHCPSRSTYFILPKFWIPNNY